MSALSLVGVGPLVSRETTLAGIDQLLTRLGARIVRIEVCDGDYRLRLRDVRGLHYGSGKRLDVALSDALDSMLAARGPR